MASYLGRSKIGECYIKPNKPSIPCIEQKCLKFAVCKTKKQIICSDLLRRYHTIELDGSWDPWDIMRDYFPNLSDIEPI